MELPELLTERKAEIVDAAAEAVARNHLASYETAGPQVTRERLDTLFDRVVECVGARQLDPIRDFGRQLAEERFRAGYDLLEVQTAINVLEEAVWKVIVRELKPEQYATAFALTSTVLGVAKDVLACQYVRLASHARTPCVDVEALFSGTDPRRHEH
jgi:hypothetical protein